MLAKIDPAPHGKLISVPGLRSSRWKALSGRRDVRLLIISMLIGIDSLISYYCDGAPPVGFAPSASNFHRMQKWSVRMHTTSVSRSTHNWLRPKCQPSVYKVIRVSSVGGQTLVSPVPSNSGRVVSAKLAGIGTSHLFHQTSQGRGILVSHGGCHLLDGHATRSEKCTRTALSNALE